MINLTITIEQHTGLVSYSAPKKPNIKKECSYVTIDLHDENKLYWGMDIRWPIGEVNQPNIIKDIIQFCNDSSNKRKILYCLKCDKYKHLNRLAKVLLDVVSVNIENNYGKYIWVHNDLFPEPVKCMIDQNRYNNIIKEKEVRRLRNLLNGYKNTHIDNGQFKMEKINLSIEERKNVLEELQKLEPNENDLITGITVEYIDEENKSTYISDESDIKYSNMTESDKRVIRFKAKEEFAMNNVSPKDMWNPIKNEEISSHSLISLNSVIPNVIPKPIQKVNLHNINLSNDDNDDSDFFNQLKI